MKSSVSYRDSSGLDVASKVDSEAFEVRPMKLLPKLVDRIQYLVRASDSLDNFVGISSPSEGFRFSVVFDDEAIDCCLQIDDR
jgi:hypothetical protein